MIRGNIKNISISSVHIIDKKINRCDGFGKIFIAKKFRYCRVPDYNFFYLDHYQYKSTQEFVEKLNFKGDCILINNDQLKYKKIVAYFKNNKKSIEKINYISKNTGLNVTYIKEKLFSKTRKIIL